jgi:hypothetical protein
MCVYPAATRSCAIRVCELITLREGEYCGGVGKVFKTSLLDLVLRGMLRIASSVTKILLLLDVLFVV